MTIFLAVTTERNVRTRRVVEFEQFVVMEILSHE